MSYLPMNEYIGYLSQLDIIKLSKYKGGIEKS